LKATLSQTKISHYDHNRVSTSPGREASLVVVEMESRYIEKWVTK